MRRTAGIALCLRNLGIFDFSVVGGVIGPLAKTYTVGSRIQEKKIYISSLGIRLFCALKIVFVRGRFHKSSNHRKLLTYFFSWMRLPMILARLEYHTNLSPIEKRKLPVFMGHFLVEKY